MLNLVASIEQHCTASELTKTQLILLYVQHLDVPSVKNFPSRLSESQRKSLLYNITIKMHAASFDDC